MVIIFAAHAAVTPAGNPVAAPMPVAPVVVWVIGVSAVLIHNVGVDDAVPDCIGCCDRDRTCCTDCSAASCKRYAVIKCSDAVGVPLMVIVFAAHAAVTPAGNPVAVPMPVAPVVVCVIGVSAVLIHSVGVDDACLTVLAAVTVIVPVALTVPQPPVSGML